MSRWLIVLALGIGVLGLALWSLLSEPMRPVAERGAELPHATHETPPARG
jgi:hypothetical protein